MNKSPSKKSFLSPWFDRWFSSLWVARGVAIIACVNLVLVVFDASYIPLRDFWMLGKIHLFNWEIGPLESEGIEWKILTPTITNFVTKYDVIKGIVPYRDTKKYLQKVEEIKTKQEQLNSPEAAKILADLRQRSEAMIDNNPFQLANKTGTLEKIKNKMREHVPNPENSAKQAFREFWSQEYLRGKAFEELHFFEQEIQPLIATNYFRPIGDTGDFVDYFGLIDFPFFVIFLVDFLGRTLYISRCYTGVNWRDAMLWRWYDIFLLIPAYRWLRVIPVTVRLNQTKLIDLRAIQKQAIQGFVASIAEDLTKVVVVSVINKFQDVFREGEISKILARSEIKPYIDINETNETAEIVKLMTQLIIYQVLPQVRNDIEALIAYNIEKFLNQSPALNGIHQLPGVKQLQSNMTEQLVRQTYQVIYQTLQNLLEEDPVFDELLKKLVENASQSINSEIQGQKSIEKIELLLTDLLEEVKINYVQNLSEEDVETILEQTRGIRQGKKNAT